MRYIIAVSHIRQLQAIQPAELFFQRENVRERLAWMIEIAQGIDDRNARPVREIVNRLLGERARDNRIRPAVEIPCNVFQRLPFADNAGLRDRVSAELLRREFESHPRAQRGLLEQQGDGPAFQRRRKTLARLFHLLRYVKKVL